MNPKLWTKESLLPLDSETLINYQEQELKELLVSVYENSPYYKAKFDNAGVNPHQFVNLSDLAEYPTFDKYEERKSQALSLEKENHPLGMHLTCDIKAVNRMSASSGTTGTPSFQGHTYNDRQVIFKNFARLMDVAGCRPGDRVMMAGVMSMWVAGIPTVDALLDYGANVIPIGGLVGTAKVLEMMTLTKPEVLICTPSFARVLVKKAKGKLNVDLPAIGIKKIFVYGEPGGGVREIIDEIESGFGQATVFDMAGGTGCLNPIFVSCEKQDGMHFIAPDEVIIELYDRKKNQVLPISDGAIGELVYTGLHRECGPLIRFKDGDLVQVFTNPCGCGFPGIRIKFIGRVDDMLLVKGVNVFPTAIRDLVMSFGQRVTGQVRVLKPSESPVVEPPLTIKVECKGKMVDDEKSLLKLQITETIQRQLRFKPEIELYDEGFLNIEYGATGKTQIIEKDY